MNRGPANGSPTSPLQPRDVEAGGGPASGNLRGAAGPATPLSSNAGVVRRLWHRHKPRRQEGESSLAFVLRFSLMCCIIVMGRCPTCRTFVIAFFVGSALCLAAYLSGGWLALGSHVLQQVGLQGAFPAVQLVANQPAMPTASGSGT
eukprot:EG_transcript_25978